MANKLMMIFGNIFILFRITKAGPHISTVNRSRLIIRAKLAISNHHHPHRRNLHRNNCCRRMDSTRHYILHFHHYEA